VQETEVKVTAPDPEQPLIVVTVAGVPAEAVLKISA
jgi:hypothetical protein